MTFWTDRLHLRATPAIGLRALAAYLAAAVVLMMPLALKGPDASPIGEIAAARLWDGQGAWRDVDITALTLPRDRVSVLSLRIRIDPVVATSDEPVGLYLSGTFAADATLNGRPIGAKGRPGASRAAETPGAIDTVLPIPSGLLRAGDNVLTLRMSAARLDHGVRSVIHGRGSLFGLRVAPFSAETRRPIGYYAAPFFMSGVLLLGLAALALRGEAFSAGGLFLAALAVTALAELSRSLVNYPYPLHDLRLIALTAAATTAAAAILMHARSVAGLCARRHLGFAVAGVILVGAGLAWRDGGMITAAAIAGAALAGWAAVRGRPGGLELCAALAVMAVFALLDAPGFMDRSLYAAAAPLVAHLVWRRRSDPVAATVSPAEPFGDRLAVGPADARRFIPHAAIQAIHGAGDYAELRLAGGERVLHAETLQALEQRLPAAFLRVHRSHLVNLEAVRSLQAQGGGRYRLSLPDGAWLPVSRTRVADLRLRLGG